ncbi:hypothetical protein ScPMuIL_016708 [Solemya velum]
MVTLEERENLFKPDRVNYSAFMPRSAQRLAILKQPRTMLNIECNHFLRTRSANAAHGHATLEHRLWLEAGKYSAPFPQRPDSNYNSNIWRNFRRQYALKMSADDGNISDVIAAMYPLNVPCPSKVGEHSLRRYIQDTSLFKSEKHKSIALHRARTDAHELNRMKALSEARNPPMDTDGNILPPENFKKYEHRFIPYPDPLPTPPPDNLRTDSLGQRYVARSQPHLWKLSTKLNHPQFEHLRKEIIKKKEMLNENRDDKPLQIVTLPSPVRRHEI